MSVNKTNQANVGVVGFTIFMETGLDLTPASIVVINVRKPDGSSAAFTATAATRLDANANTLYGAEYTTTDETDLNMAGKWELQVVVTMPGFTGPGDIATLEVGEALV